MNTIIQTIKSTSSACYWAVWIHIACTLLCLVGWMIDDRMIMGINAWVKPLKFMISGGIYIATVGYLLSLYPYSARKTKIIDNVVAWTLVVEILIICMQAARGVQSHYNTTTAFDGILFAIMGLFIGINVVVMALFIFDSIRLKMKVARTMQYAILMGWLVVFFGSWVGGQMIQQLGHNVGVADGGDGLPILNWSTIAGDLRVAHFFGLHGIQIIPLVALLITKGTKWTSRHQTLIVVLFGILYMGWVAFTLYQAKQGIALLKA